MVRGERPIASSSKIKISEGKRGRDLPEVIVIVIALSLVAFQLPDTDN